ncbi:hypothetical protein LY76DRAFT_325008 [Colletotrichum caudatum]|nr:hypothetical protein LY76DRAFT_325008 [Colletotrichum caudatum]
MKPMLIFFSFCSWEITHTPPLIVAFCAFRILEFLPSLRAPPVPVYAPIPSHPIPSHPSIGINSRLDFPPSPIHHTITRKRPVYFSRETTVPHQSLPFAQQCNHPADHKQGPGLPLPPQQRGRPSQARLTT